MRQGFCNPGVMPDDAAIIIGDLYRKACASLVDSANYYIAAGRALIEKKAELEHGAWLPWLAANADVLGFASERTAQLLMKQAANTKLAFAFERGRRAAD
jgi:hypothetical protein